MRVPALAACLLLSAVLARAEDLRSRFTGDEAWMLAVVLSDPEQQKAFESQAAAASNGDAAAKNSFEQRWRKRIVEFANAYHQHLTTNDIVAGAPSIERMVDDWEFAVMNHRLNHLPEAKRQEALKDLSDGNAFLGWARGKVEDAVREKRRKLAQEISAYIVSPPAVKAVSFVDTPAIDVARQASGSGQAGRHAPTEEEASRRAGEVFNQTPPRAGDTPAPVQAGPPPVSVPAPAAGGGGTTPERPGLSAPVTASPGGFRVAPPPSPIVNRDAPAQKGNPWGVLARKALPAAGGGLLGALIGFLVGGPIGALVGAAIGGLAGYAAGKALEK
ncbi:MAG: hypothetical protein HY553_15815 [Elusimicrobia bacterium]|nr:hypothetical protein [Elusimicrobiota bacterium]